MFTHFFYYLLDSFLLFFLCYLALQIELFALIILEEAKFSRKYFRSLECRTMLAEAKVRLCCTLNVAYYWPILFQFNWRFTIFPERTLLKGLLYTMGAYRNFCAIICVQRILFSPGNVSWLIILSRPFLLIVSKLHWLLIARWITELVWWSVQRIIIVFVLIAIVLLDHKFTVYRPLMTYFLTTHARDRWVTLTGTLFISFDFGLHLYKSWSMGKISYKGILLVDFLVFGVDEGFIYRLIHWFDIGLGFKVMLSP